MIAELPALGLWGIFYIGALELPQSMFPYMIGILFVAPAMAMLIESVDRRAFRS